VQAKEPALLEDRLGVLLVGADINDDAAVLAGGVAVVRDAPGGRVCADWRSVRHGGVVRAAGEPDEGGGRHGKE
jgi:hypothetical protein